MSCCGQNQAIGHKINEQAVKTFFFQFKNRMITLRQQLITMNVELKCPNFGKNLSESWNASVLACLFLAVIPLSQFSFRRQTSPLLHSELFCLLRTVLSGVTLSKCYLRLNSGSAHAEQQMGMKNTENTCRDALTLTSRHQSVLYFVGGVQLTRLRRLASHLHAFSISEYFKYS